MAPNKCRKGKLIVRTASAPVTLSFIDYARLLPVLTYLLRDMYGLSNPSVNFRESRLVREGWGGGRYSLRCVCVVLFCVFIYYFCLVGCCLFFVVVGLVVFLGGGGGGCVWFCFWGEDVSAVCPQEQDIIRPVQSSAAILSHLQMRNMVHVYVCVCVGGGGVNIFKRSCCYAGKDLHRMVTYNTKQKYFINP